MGYTTNFNGQLEFSRPLTVIEYNELSAMNEDPDRCYKYTDKGEIPDSYMQWVSNKDGTALEWDGGEKFYNYTHWLRWLIKHYLKPRGIDLNGTIRWQGEEVGDVGTITVLDNKVTSQKIDINLTECPQCGHKFENEK
jgi:hypothetical protein